MPSETPIGAYDPATARMILDVVRYLVANGYVLRKKEPVRSLPLANMFIAYTISAIPARNGTTAGMGTAELRDIYGEDGTDAVITDVPDFPEPINVYNISDAAVSTGKYIAVNREGLTGKWIVTLESCG